MITLVRNPFLTVEIRGNTAVIWLDQEGETVNKISPELILSFARVLDEIENLPDIRGAVLISRKKDFIAGADLAGLLEMEPGRTCRIRNDRTWNSQPYRQLQEDVYCSHSRSLHGSRT